LNRYIGTLRSVPPTIDYSFQQELVAATEALEDSRLEPEGLWAKSFVLASAKKERYRFGEE
jgi:hypothetical protein